MSSVLELILEIFVFTILQQRNLEDKLNCTQWNAKIKFHGIASSDRFFTGENWQSSYGKIH